MNIIDCKLGMLVDSTYHKVEGATIIAIDDKYGIIMNIALGYYKGFNTPAGGGIDANSYNLILSFTKNIISKNEFNKFNLYGWVFSEYLNVVSNVAIDKKENGCICFSCKEFYPYAQPNQTNGTLKCYSCRTY